jgi:hypothetical protein
MTTEGVRVPTVADTVRTYARDFLGDFSTLRGMLSLGLLVAVVLVLPPMKDVGPLLLSNAILLIGISLHAGYRERRFGGPDRLAVAATMTTLAVGAAWASVFLLAWAILGGRLGFWRVLREIPPDAVITALLVLAAFIVIRYFHIKPERERRAAAFEAQVRAERARRGVSTVV